MPGEQIDGHHGGDHRSADVHRNYCSGPLGDDWNDISHSEEINLLLRQHTVLGQVRDWNIEITTNNTKSH
jgi:hypothetical protein